MNFIIRLCTELKNTQNLCKDDAFHSGTTVFFLHSPCIPKEKKTRQIRRKRKEYRLLCKSL